MGMRDLVVFYSGIGKVVLVPTIESRYLVPVPIGFVPVLYHLGF